MKIPPAYMFPASSGPPQSLVELLAAPLAENERQTKSLDELRQENAALRQENLALQDRLNRDSTNSNQTPSQDSPFQKPQTPSASADPESRGSALAAAKNPDRITKVPANTPRRRMKSSPARPGRAPAAARPAWMCACGGFISGSNCPNGSEESRISTCGKVGVRDAASN